MVYFGATEKIDDRKIMTNILITGGHGYIGSHAVYVFLEAGYEIAIVDNHSAGMRVSFPENVRCYEGDVGDEVLLERIFTEFQPHAVIHFAGSIIVPMSIAHPESYYRNNPLASLYLIQACLRHRVRHFVFSSTAAVYGLLDKGVAVEDSRQSPINPYGWSKWMVEQMLADIGKAHDFHYAALRYFNVAGADPKLRIGQSTPQATHLVKVACEVAVGKRDHIDLFGTDYDTPDGTCLRDFIHVWDLARAHLAAFDYIRDHAMSAVFNCGNGQGSSVREVIAAVEDAAGHRICAIDADRRLGDPPILIADPSLMKRKTSWQAQFPDMHAIIASALAREKKSQS